MIRQKFARHAKKFTGLALAAGLATAAGNASPASQFLTPERALRSIGADPALYAGPLVSPMTPEIRRADMMTLQFFNRHVRSADNRQAENPLQFRSFRSYATFAPKVPCRVFFNATPDMAYRDARLYAGAEPLESWISRKDISTYVLLHELRHCAQPVKGYAGEIGAGYSLMRETDADLYAIRAMEKNNPHTRIRDYVLAWRTLHDGYKNALALQYALEGRPQPSLSAVLRSRNAFYTASVAIIQMDSATYGAGLQVDAGSRFYLAARRISLENHMVTDPMMRDWAALRVKAFETMRPRAATAAREAMFFAEPPASNGSLPDPRSAMTTQVATAPVRP